jgi:hypothetical protein
MTAKKQRPARKHTTKRELYKMGSQEKSLREGGNVSKALPRTLYDASTRSAFACFHAFTKSALSFGPKSEKLSAPTHSR